MMKDMLRATVIASVLLLVMSGVNVPVAHAGGSCGGPGQDCCDFSACNSGLVCDNSNTCVSCGEENEPCCDAMTCDPGLSCESTGMMDVLSSGSLEGRGGGAGGGGLPTCINCGDANEPCCDGITCNDGTTICLAGTCTSCGGENQPCCDPDGCDAGLVCEPCFDEVVEGQGGGAIGGCPIEQLEGTGSGGTVGGVCLACGGADQPCCDAMGCDSGLICTNDFDETPGQGSGAAGFLNGTCIPCGGLSDPCCDGTTCNSGDLLCNAGICESCGGSGEQCCEFDQCDTGSICDAALCIPCGGVNDPCCEGLTCDPGLSCENPQCDDTLHSDSLEASGGGATLGPEICVDCGDAGEPCCGGTDCNTGAICNVGTCEACGGSGEPCCDARVCDSGFVCEPVCLGETLEGQGSGAAGSPCTQEQLAGIGGGAGPSAVEICQPCGGATQPCCDEMSCDEGFTCMMLYTETPGQGGGAEGFLNGSCFPCGALGEPCCDDSMCSDDNLLCGGELCEACGDIGEQCCANNTCPNSASICSEGVCDPLPAAPAMGGWGLAALLLMLTGLGAFRLKRG